MADPLTALLIAGAIAAVLGVLLWPERGVISSWRRARQLSTRVRIEDALKHIHGCEMRGEPFSHHSLAGALQISVDEASDLVFDLEKRGLLRMQAEGVRLTTAGRRSALHILRAHRLWERYLADETGLSELEWHGQAEQREHQLTPDEVDSLSARLGNPTHDPHGDPIPTAEGDLVPHGGMPVVSADLDVPLLIVHIEDEPSAVYAQLVAEGLYPGMELRLIENSPQRVRFWSGQDEHVLAPIVAANISVLQRHEQAQAEPMHGQPLSALQPGERARVLAISSQCRGLERRRLQDLGVLPGAEIRAEFVSPGTDPTAYRIREAIVALRKDQAEQIIVERSEAPA
jgi:DtxR family Mn-dependent transcriptional regulator